MTELQKAYHKAYYREHKAKQLEASKRRYQVHKEAIKARSRAYYKANKEAVSAKNRKRCKLHPEWHRNGYLRRKKAIRAYQRRWRQANPEKHRAIQLRWIVKNRARLKHLDQARRARIKGSTINPEQIIQFFDRIRHKRTIACYYCKTPVKGKLAHIDHIIPLSKGGPHSVENLCATCPSCNLTKCAKPVGEWQPPNQSVLTI